MKSKKKGLTLLEIVITLSIISIVGVAVSNMTIMALKTSKDSKGIYEEDKLVQQIMEQIKISNGTEADIKDKIIGLSQISGENNELKLEQDESNYLVSFFDIHDKDNIAVKVEINQKTEHELNPITDKITGDEMEIDEGTDNLVFIRVRNVICGISDETDINDEDHVHDEPCYKYKVYHKFIGEPIGGEENLKTYDFSSFEDGENFAINSSFIVEDEKKDCFIRKVNEHELNIEVYDLGDYENDDITINILLKKYTKNASQSEAAPKYTINNYSNGFKVNVITRSIIEEGEISNLGDKREFSVSIVEYDSDYKILNESNVYQGYINTNN